MSVIAGYEVHPAAELFPLVEGRELQDLADDIKANGLLNPITLLAEAGKRVLLDGRNRLRACELAGVEPTTEFWAGEGSPVSWVVSQNLRRRHMNESQRAMVAAGLVPLFEGEAKGRQGRRDLPANLPERGEAREKAAAAVNVSPRSVASAQVVQREGAPELADAVKQGRVAVSTAAVLAEDPPDRQRQVVAMGEAEILKRAKEIRAERQEVRREERYTKISEIARGNRPVDGVKPCPVVYADPPWEYGNTASVGAVADEYPTMPLADICALKCPATDDAVLFLWATSPLLPEAMQVIAAWGFTYKGSMVWDKGSGTGNWVLNAHELLLIAVKGDIPPPQPANRPKSVVSIPRGAHSAKPEEFAQLIERMYPTLQKVEMFARKTRDGWTVWGNQAA